MSITLIIPQEVSTEERRNCLARAKQQFHRAKMRAGRAMCAGRLPELRHARKQMNRARDMVRAWTEVQIIGRIA